MALSNIGATSTKVTNNTISAAAANNSLNQQEFLKLLTTELQNQDPTNPQDEKAFLGQLAQFSTVEGVNSLQTTTKQDQATSLLGKTVDAYVTKNGVPTYVSGQVTSVRFGTDGVHLSVKGSSTELSLTDLNSISS